ncbi:hypothetical protein [Parapedobacter tibetensis]|uniref:hypothetical protein n=1 Tax=Parapedobacter tibetensis TaxID=2972951 RepID=UPI00214D9D23|nr:hypothetical protein [Parapedobacter tibetensis]
MYRNAITFLFLILILYSSTSAVWINMAFLLNRGYVAENLCRERQMLDNACQGQCVLMKKLKETQEKDTEQSKIKVQELQLVFTQITWSCDLEAIAVAPDSNPVPRDQAPYAYNFTFSLFRPPIS